MVPAQRLSDTMVAQAATVGLVQMVDGEAIPFSVAAATVETVDSPHRQQDEDA